MAVVGGETTAHEVRQRAVCRGCGVREMDVSAGVDAPVRPSM